MGKIGFTGKKHKGAVNGLKTVTTAGTPETLSTSHIFCNKLRVQVLFANTSIKAAIAESASVLLATEVGNIIAKGNFFDFEGVYLDEIFVDVGTDGDKVYFEGQRGA